MSIFTADLFATGNDEDNRAAVRKVHTQDLDLVAILIWPVIFASIAYYLIGTDGSTRVLFVASLGGVYFPIMLLTRLARRGRPGETQMTRGQLVFLGVYLSVTTAAAWMLPLWPMLAFADLCWLASVVVNMIPFRPGAAQLIWRSPRTRQVRSIPMRRLFPTRSRTISKRSPRAGCRRRPSEANAR